MDSKRIALLLIAVAATGIFALPGTMSLFAGQHVWYDLSGGGNDVPCEKCHADVVAEMDALEGPHTGETGYGMFECEYCHRIFPVWRRNSTFESYTYASGDGTGAEPGVEAHAASTVACMYCHSGDKSGTVEKDPGQHPRTSSNCWSSCHNDPENNPNDKPAHEGAYTNDEDCIRCHGDDYTEEVYYVPPAGGFNLTINATDTGNNAAHKTFVMDAIDDSLMEDANEACIACHTHVAVKINWAHARVLEFDVGLPDDPEDITTTSGVHNWSLTNWTVNQTASATVYGNTTGNGTTTYGVSDWPGDVENIYE